MDARVVAECPDRTCPVQPGHRQYRSHV